jgi:AcrR family transcriptional regulator
MVEPNLLLHESPPSRSDAVKNRTLLLETAARLFAEQGVEAVTMSAIAEAAAVGKGTLYRHFENKIVLCQALLDHDQRALQDRTLARLREHGNPLDNLHWFLVEVTEFVERNRPLLCAGVPAISTLQTPAHWWWHQTIRGLLAQINAPGDLDYMTDMIYVLLDIRTFNFLRDTRGYRLEWVQENLLAAVDRLVSY